jgi:hypothetical protein
VRKLVCSGINSEDEWVEEAKMVVREQDKTMVKEDWLLG